MKTVKKVKVKQQTIKSLTNSWIYNECKPNYVNEEETFSIYDLGNVDVFSKLYKVYNQLRFGVKKPSTPLQHSILTDFEFGREDSEIYSHIDKLNINEVFDFIDFIDDDSYIIQNSNSDSVCEYFEKYKRLK
jgi:hypothetical protein